MKWDFETKKVPAFGSKRLAVKFALLPTVCNNNHKHWLGFVIIRQWRGTCNWWDDPNTTCICPASPEGQEFLKS